MAIIVAERPSESTDAVCATSNAVKAAKRTNATARIGKAIADGEIPFCIGMILSFLRDSVAEA
jgi:hypothetical protein